jgi:hypothetical protein
MLGRRDFLAKSLGAGVVLATVGLPDLTKASAATVVRGYGVGQVMPPVVGLDQYNLNRRLANYRGSWKLIDLCPWWCQPCRASATRHAEFGRYMRANGIPFRIFSVVVEDLSHAVSHRFDAERWAERFGLCNDTVLHCNGDPQSPLRNLVDQFASANGSGQPAYPTYALVDPLGVVRYYQEGADLNALQAQLAAFTGKTLTATWDLADIPDTFVSLVATVVEATGNYDDGTPFNATVTFDGGGGDLRILDSTILPLDGFTSAITTASWAFPGVPDFAHDTPVTLTFTQTAPHLASPFTRVTSVAPGVAIAPDDAITFDAGGVASVDTSNVLIFSPPISVGANGLTLNVPPFVDSTRKWSTIWFNDTATTPGPERWALSYSLTDTLITDVSASTLTSLVKTGVTTQLQAVRHTIGTRHFTSAAAHALRAEQQLALAGANLGLQADVSWLAAHLTDLASQT